MLTELKLLYGEYAVEFVIRRPGSGDYTMAMVGGNGQGCKGGGAAVGISPLDCKNTEKNDVVLIYKMQGASARQLALVIAHELGHSFGLEHVDDQKDIMYPQLNGATCCWTEANVQGGSTCGRSSQDAEQVLTENLGVGEGDKVAPRVWFVRPGPDALLPERFTVEAAAADDLKVHHVEFYVDGKQLASVAAEPFVASVDHLSPGEHTIKAVAFDYKPNEVTAQIKVRVDAGCVAAGTCWPGKLGLGVSCEAGADCLTGVCASEGGAGYCTDACEKRTPVCPGTLACLAAGGEDYYCASGAGFTVDVAAADEGGCSCAAAGAPGAGGVGLLLLLGLLLACRRPRAPRCGPPPAR